MKLIPKQIGAKPLDKISNMKNRPLLLAVSLFALSCNSSDLEAEQEKEAILSGVEVEATTSDKLDFDPNQTALTEHIEWDTIEIHDHVLPQAYKDEKTSIEKAINTYLQDTYLNQEEAHRYSFLEYETLCPTANICGVSITYEYMFNTAPGIWSFTDFHYFDLQSREKLTLDKLFHENGKVAFSKMINERKNSFVNEFGSTIQKEQEDYEKLLEIVDYTLNDSIELDKIEGYYRFIIEADSISLTKDWEYAWGIGRHELPYMILKSSFHELEPMLNDYGKHLLLGSKNTPTK